ncbi:MAG: ABC transporter substrate-binding protein [Phycisphaeraceae bacterium]|nr:MAG: ABC transporter substrate-binding protein [Phycisphaeraceae bacterium]
MPPRTLAIALAILASPLAIAAPDTAPEPIRVGGDMHRAVDFDGEIYRSEQARVNTALPEGYPRPTPPGAIEIKEYPLVRRAEFTGAVNPDRGMMIAFYPLFLHIQSRDIAMTAPVEMDYRDWEGDGRPREWTMSFLYRTADMGEEGGAERGVTVRDIQPVTVLSIGLAGQPRTREIDSALETLRLWIAEQDEWEITGDPRALFYNGPSDPLNTRWSEAQLPIRRVNMHENNARDAEEKDEVTEARP